MVKRTDVYHSFGDEAVHTPVAAQEETLDSHVFALPRAIPKIDLPPFEFLRPIIAFSHCPKISPSCKEKPTSWSKLLSLKAQAIDLVHSSLFRNRISSLRHANLRTYSEFLIQSFERPKALALQEEDSDLELWVDGRLFFVWILS